MRSLIGVEGIRSLRQPSRQIVPTFVVRSSGVKAYLEAPLNESGNYSELALVAACQINVEPHLSVRVTFRDQVLHR